MPLCSFSPCDRKASGPTVDLCDTHRKQMQRGRPLKPIKPAVKYKSIEDRFWAKVNKRGPMPKHMPGAGRCWQWKAGLYPTGYGQFGFTANGVMTPKVAHRVAWIWEHGEIEDSIILDHMCHNRRCVRPAHLRESTYALNAQNRSGAPSNSTTGVRGVTWVNSELVYRARVKVAGITHERYGFKTLAEAEAAAIALRREYMPASFLDQYTPAA